MCCSPDSRNDSLQQFANSQRLDVPSPKRGNTLLTDTIREIYYINTNGKVLQVSYRAIQCEIKGRVFILLDEGGLGEFESLRGPEPAG